MHRAIMLGSVLHAVLSSPLGATTTVARQDLPPSDTTALTIAEARTLALRQNPALLADLERIGAASAELRTARTYPHNPAIEVEGPSSLSDRGPDRYEIRFGQEVELAGQRGRRVAAAEAGLSAARAEAANEARVVLADVERTWFTLAAAVQRLDVAREIRTLNDRLLDAVRIQLSEGEVSLLQANLVEIEAARARARVLAVGQDVAEAELALIRLTGLPASATVRTAAAEVGAAVRLPDTSLPELSATALSNRPDLTASRAYVGRAESLRSLATREALPNVGIAGIAEREAPGVAPRFGLAFSVPVPLFDRNQGLREGRAVEVRQAGLTVQAVELRIRTEVADAFRAWQAAARQVQLFESDVLAPARENQRLLETAYQEGKLDLSTLLLLRNQLLDAELGYWEAWEQQRMAEVALRSATATILDDLNLDFREDSR